MAKDSTSMHAVRPALVTLALVALGLWMGGMVALGAIAAPVVFGMVPAPTSGDAMTVVFRRFDKLAIGCLIVVLAVEAALAVLRDRKIERLDLVRGGLATGAAAAAVYVAAFVSPQIEALHRAGAIRGFGSAGEQLDAIHQVAQRAGKLELLLGIAVVALHVAALTRTTGARQKRD
jgi:uncharacterized membrane protein